MKKIISFLSIFFIAVTHLNSCKKEIEDNPVDNSTVTIGEWTATAYRNQTGNPAAEALQAQFINNTQHYTLNVYGSFNTLNEPEKARSITFEKQGNDTITYLTLNEQTQKIETAYTVVNGIKQPYVIKHSYINGNDNAMRISIYEYNWTNNTSALKYEALYETGTPGILEYNSFKTTNGFTDYLVGIGTGVAFAETIFYATYGGGAGLLGSAAGVAAVAAGVVIVKVAAAVVVVHVVTALLNPAGAAVLTPGTLTVPPGTPVNNPVPDPVLNLPPTPCNNVNITFVASMDGFGSIMIFGVEGGEPGYEFSLDDSPFQQSQVFDGPYTPGSYLIMIKDANGCVKAEVRPIAQTNLAIVTTTLPSAITLISAASGGNVTNDGGAQVTARGVCWSTNIFPTTSNFFTDDGTGAGTFTSNLTGLTSGITYHARAYATNSVGTAYGDEVTFITRVLAVGDTFQGGIIGYILLSGDPGYDTTNQHGLIAAYSDQGTYTNWGCTSVTISGADGTAIGTGNQNTLDIIAGCGEAGIAARLCADLDVNGYSDWYLPSKEELDKLYLNKIAIGGFSSYAYWSSTEHNSVPPNWQDNQFAVCKWFNGAPEAISAKDGTGSGPRVRPVRAF